MKQKEKAILIFLFLFAVLIHGCSKQTAIGQEIMGAEEHNVARVEQPIEIIEPETMSAVEKTLPRIEEKEKFQIFILRLFWRIGRQRF